MDTTLFIGGGRIASAMIAGLRLAGNESRIVVYDKNAGRMRNLRRTMKAETVSNIGDALRDASLLVLSVRPDAAEEVIKNLRPFVLERSEFSKKRLAAVSVMAGIPLSWLRASLGSRIEWSRAMPSPLCNTGRGLTALAFDRACRKQTRRRVIGLFSAFGAVLTITESKLNAFTVVYSPSHGLHALSALTDAATRIGLDKKTAEVAAAHALADSIAAMREESGNLERMLRTAATPGGVAEATMRAMDSGGYRSAVRDGLSQGMSKARSMRPKEREKS